MSKLSIIPAVFGVIPKKDYVQKKNDNNGWTRVFTHMDLPIDGGEFKIGIKKDCGEWVEFGGIFSDRDVRRYYALGDITHFREVFEQKGPNY